LTSTQPAVEPDPSFLEHRPLRARATGLQMRFAIPLQQAPRAGVPWIVTASDGLCRQMAYGPGSQYRTGWLPTDAHRTHRQARTMDPIL
jgi:hypothetical protein